MSSLEVTIGKLSLRNPTMLASGVMDETAGSFLKVARAGAGAVVTKSIGSEPRNGYANPTLIELDEGYINAMGLPNPGIEAFAEEMSEARSCPVPIIGSIFASSAKEFGFLASKMQSYGAAAIELNLSCPHARGYGAEIGSNPATVRSITAGVSDAVKIPVLAKLTPNTRDIASLGLAAEEGGASAVVAINTLRAMAIDARLRRPALANKYGGLSGPAVKPVGLRCVYELYEALSIPIIGVGGISDAVDIAEYIMAGASAVQVGTVVGRGLQVFSELADGLRSFMSEEGFKNIEQMRGIVHD